MKRYMAKTEKMTSKMTLKPGVEGYQKLQAPKPCFVCDDLAGKDAVSLRFGLTSSSSTALPTKIGQLMGDNFMIVVTDVDVLCKRCSALLNHLDKLEQDMNVVKKALTGYLKKKYHLTDDLQPTIGVENEALTLQALKQLDFGLDQTAKTSELNDFDKENGHSGVKIENDSSAAEDIYGSDKEHSVEDKPPRKTSDSAYHKTGEFSEAGNKKGEKRPQIDEMTVKRVKVAKSSSDDVTIYRCMSCKFKSPRMDQFMQHLKVHPKKTYYKCSECGKHFEKKEDARNHIESVHKFSDAECEDDMQEEDVDEPVTKKLYECATCGYEDSDKEEYENHLQSHEPVKFHECKICAKKFRSKQFLQKHVANHRLFKCGVCGKIFKIKADLLLHFKVHKSDRSKPVGEGNSLDIQKSSSAGGSVTAAKSGVSETPKVQLREDFDKVEQMLEIMHSEAPKLHVDDQKDVEGEKLYVQQDEGHTWDENATDQNWDITNEAVSSVGDTEVTVPENSSQDNVAMRTIDIIEDKMDMSASVVEAADTENTVEEATENDSKDKHSDTTSLPPTIDNEDDESRLQGEGSSATEDAIDDSMAEGIDHLSGMQLYEIRNSKTENICDEMQMQCTNESSLPFQVDEVAADTEKFEGKSIRKPTLEECTVRINNSSLNENSTIARDTGKVEHLDSLEVSATGENFKSLVTLPTVKKIANSEVFITQQSSVKFPVIEENSENTDVSTAGQNICIEVPAEGEYLECVNVKATDENLDCIEVPATDDNLECIEVAATDENLECMEVAATDENLECLEVTATEENLECVEVTAADENLEYVEVVMTDENLECIEVPATEENLECMEASMQENVKCVEENFKYVQVNLESAAENVAFVEENFDCEEENFDCAEENFDYTEENFDSAEEKFECLEIPNMEGNFEFVQIPVKCEKVDALQKPLSQIYYDDVKHSVADNSFKDVHNSLSVESLGISQTEVEDKSRYTKPLEKIYVCSMCGFKTTVINNLKKHFKSHVVIDNKFYECHICKKLLKTEGSLNRHLTKHSLGEKHVPCTLCSKLFEDALHLKQHMEDEHCYNYQCSYCDQVFPNKKLYLRHEKTHPERLCFRCDRCEDAFETEIKLKTHLTNVHGDSSYELGSVTVFKCDQCGKVLNTQHNLKKHILDMHTFPSVFKCSDCSATFSEQWQLRQHTVQQHPVDIRCSYCKNAFPSQEACRVHEETHHNIPFVCEACGKGFTSQSALGKHEVEMHRDEPNCKICSKFIPDPGKLYNHERRHSRMNKQFICAVCNRSFMTRSGVAHHMSVHTGKYPYYCEVCGKGVHSPMLLEEHRASHTKEIRHICDLCGRMFSSSSTYRMHRVWHDNPLPYKCDICGQRFKHTSILSVHKRRSHTGERPYKCPYCPYSFAVGSTMKKHIILHTKQFPYVCEHCSKGFTTRLKYVNHKKSIHKDFTAPPLKRKCEYKMVLRPEEVKKQVQPEK